MRNTLRGRHGKEIEPQLAATEVMPGGAGIDSDEEIGDCVISVLQVESDHLRKQKISMDQQLAQSDHDSPGTPTLSPNFWGD